MGELIGLTLFCLRYYDCGGLCGGNKGCKFSYADAATIEPCVSRVHALVESCLHRLGTKEGREKLSSDHDLHAFGAGEL